jgi:low affinity Fe/Cu permease
MSSILDSSRSAVRDIEPSAIKPMRFSNFARYLAMLAVLVWAATGPLFGYSDTWQLVINTSTTIITFLMVFVIQNTQNRDTAAIQIKLDELIRATQGAHNAILDLEHLDEEQLEAYLERYEILATAARTKLRAGRLDTDSPELKHPG